MLPIMEVFQSIQGEGLMMGMPAIFIRVGGCNLTCPFCDTKESWRKDHTPMTVPDIMELINKVNTNHVGYVVITGGEPLLYDLTELIDTLHENDFCVGLESNGTIDVKYAFDFVAIAPKPQRDYKCDVNFNSIDEIKFVVSEDFDPSLPNIQDLLEHYEGTVWLQPEGFNLETSRKRCMEIQSKLCQQGFQDVRVGIQLHKVMEVQ